MVSVCMFHRLSSPASAPACLLLRSMCALGHNLTSLPGRSAGFPSTTLSQLTQKGWCPSLHSSSYFPEWWLLPHNLLIAQVPGERTTSLLTNIHSTPDLVPHPSAPHQLWILNPTWSKPNLWIRGLVPAEKGKGKSQQQ